MVGRYLSNKEIARAVNPSTAISAQSNSVTQIQLPWKYSNALQKTEKMGFGAMVFSLQAVQQKLEIVLVRKSISMIYVSAAACTQ